VVRASQTYVQDRRRSALAAMPVCKGDTAEPMGELTEFFRIILSVRLLVA
jgi:hypothetical protein